MQRRLAVALTGASVVWLGALVAAPLAAAHGVASPVAALVYEAAGLVCHQRPERSFHIAGVQLPVCARCFGLYVSAAAGALLAWGAAARAEVLTSARVRTMLAVAALPTALTFAIECLDLAHPSSFARAVAAAPLGAVTGWVLLVLLRVEASEVVP